MDCQNSIDSLNIESFYIKNLPTQNSLLINAQEYPITEIEVDCVKILGDGQFSVQLYTDKPTGKEVVVQEFPIPLKKDFVEHKNELKTKEVEKIHNEIEIFNKISSIDPDYIVQFYGWTFSNDHTRIFMEPMNFSLRDLKDLYHYNTQINPYIRLEPLISIIIVSIMNGLSLSCSKQKISHGDLKPENVKISIAPFLLQEKLEKDFYFLLEEMERKRTWNNYLIEEREQNNSIVQLKRKTEVKEIVSIKNKYEDVIYGRSRKNLNEKFTTSQYIKPNCDSNTCLCHEQERLLNQSLRNLPSDSRECDTDIVSEEFTKQILAWTSSTYECAPSLRSSCKMLATSDFLFIFGGSNPNLSEKALQDVYRFNLLTRRWKKIKVDNLPTSLISYAICWDPNIEGENLVGYLFGGSEDPDGSVMSNKLYKFIINPEGGINFQNLKVKMEQNRLTSLEARKNLFDQENQTNAQNHSQNVNQSQSVIIEKNFSKNRESKRVPLRPSARCGSAMVMNSDGKLYIIGGVDSKSCLLDVWVVDTNVEQLTWQIIMNTNHLKGRYTHEIVIVEEKILLLGGGDENWSAPFDKIDAFDIKTQKFIQIETSPDGNHGYPTPRKFHSVVKNGNDIYIIGGWLDKEINEQDRSVDSVEEATIFDDIWKLCSIKRNETIYYQWTKIVSTLKMPLFFHASAVTPEGCIYTFGGCIDAKSMYPSNKLQRVWLQPPELKQISMFTELLNHPELVEIFKHRGIEQEIFKHAKDNATGAEQVVLDKQVNMEEIENNLRELRQTKPMRLISLILNAKKEPLKKIDSLK